MGFHEKYLDIVLVPLGLLMMAAYNAWLLYRIKRHPTTTVIGINALNRRLWVHSIMAEGLKQAVLGVQTIRNSMMASGLLATAAITLISLMAVIISNNSSSSSPTNALVVGDESTIGRSVKYMSIVVCFMVAFICNVQSLRYFSHASFLISVDSNSHGLRMLTNNGDCIDEEYVGMALNKGSHFWSLGLRAFYVSLPLFMWTFGPIPMFVTCIALLISLYFLDNASPSQHPHASSLTASFARLKSKSQHDNEFVTTTPLSA